MSILHRLSVFRDEGGLQAEGIFRIIGENGQEEDVRKQLNRGFVPDGVDVILRLFDQELPTGVLNSLTPEHMVDPLTALIHAVQIMNLLKTLIMKTLCEREESSSGFEPLSSCANNRSPNNKVEHPYLLKNATLKRLGSENEEQFWTFPRMSGSLGRI
ncbi:Rho GTPase-activating protein 3-like protein [Tanacetum coccineum]